MKMQRLLTKALLLIPALLFSCGQAEPCPDTSNGGSAAAGPTGEGANVLATVNGVPITEEDVRLKLARDSHETEITPKRTRNVLESLVRQELVRQRAVELGLDGDPRYREKLRPVQAQLSAFEREQLGERFFLEEIVNKAEVSEADARRHFEKNADRFRTEFHVLQILYKGDRAQAEKDLADLRAGMTFEEVSRRRFPNLPESAGEPWDLGYLKWPQIPEAWRETIVKMKPGELSGLISGPRERFWIIKLIDERENASIKFETHRAAIVESLKAEAVEARRAMIEDELQRKAAIVYTGNKLSAQGED